MAGRTIHFSSKTRSSIGRVIFTLLPVTSTTASSPVVECPGGQDEELVGGLIEEGGEAGHRVVPEVQVVDEAAEQLGDDHDVILEHLKSRDVEAGGG